MSSSRASPFHVLVIFVLSLLQPSTGHIIGGKQIKMAWLVSNSGYRQTANIATSAGALRLALNVVSTSNSLLNGHLISLKHYPVDCDVTTIITTLLTIRRTYNPDVIIGPPCQTGLKTVGLLAADWNIPIFSWYDIGTDFDNTALYPTLIRLIPSASTLGTVLVNLVQHFEQTRLTVLSYQSEPWNLVDESIRLKTKTLGISMTSHPVDAGITDHEIRQILSSNSVKSSVFALVCPSDVIRRIMLIAGKEGMTDGRFVFIRVDPEIHADNLLSDNGWKKGDGLDNEARKAYKFLIHVVYDPMYDNTSPPLPVPSNRFTEFSSIVRNTSIVNTNLWDIPVPGKPDIYSMFLYDVILSWSAITANLIKSGTDYRNGRQFAATAKTFKAKGATGFISFNNNLDRNGKVFVLSMASDGNYKAAQICRTSSSGLEIIRLAPLSYKQTLGTVKAPVVQTLSGQKGTSSVKDTSTNPKGNDININTVTTLNVKPRAPADSLKAKGHVTILSTYGKQSSLNTNLQQPIVKSDLSSSLMSVSTATNPGTLNTYPKEISLPNIIDLKKSVASSLLTTKTSKTKEQTGILNKITPHQNKAYPFEKSIPNPADAHNSETLLSMSSASLSTTGTLKKTNTLDKSLTNAGATTISAAMASTGTVSVPSAQSVYISSKKGPIVEPSLSPDTGVGSVSSGYTKNDKSKIQSVSTKIQSASTTLSHELGEQSVKLVSSTNLNTPTYGSLKQGVESRVQTASSGTQKQVSGTTKMTYKPNQMPAPSDKSVSKSKPKVQQINIALKSRNKLMLKQLQANVQDFNRNATQTIVSKTEQNVNTAKKAQNVNTAKTTNVNTAKTTNVNTAKTTNVNTAKITNVNTTKTTNVNTAKTTNVNTAKITNVNTKKTTNVNTKKTTNVNTKKTTNINTKKTTNVNTTKTTNVDTAKTTNVNTAKTTNVNTKKTTNVNTAKTTNVNTAKTANVDTAKTNINTAKTTNLKTTKTTNVNTAKTNMNTAKTTNVNTMKTSKVNTSKTGNTNIRTKTNVNIKQASNIPTIQKLSINSKTSQNLTTSQTQNTNSQYPNVMETHVPSQHQQQHQQQQQQQRQDSWYSMMMKMKYQAMMMEALGLEIQNPMMEYILENPEMFTSTMAPIPQSQPSLVLPPASINKGKAPKSVVTLNNVGGQSKRTFIIVEAKNSKGTVTNYDKIAKQISDLLNQSRLAPITAATTAKPAPVAPAHVSPFDMPWWTV